VMSRQLGGLVLAPSFAHGRANEVFTVATVSTRECAGRKTC
jgi:predicted metal-dependent RNase